MFDMQTLMLFQSTLSMRRATGTQQERQFRPVISIHALHEESDQHGGNYDDGVRISIHALHEESDLSILKYAIFLVCISIHALHEESDHSQVRSMCHGTNFNPRSP